MYAKFDESATKPPHPIGLIDDSAFTGEKTYAESIMPRLSVTLDPKLETEMVEDVSERAAENLGLFVIPSEHMGVINVGEEKRTTWCGRGRGTTIEHKEPPCVVDRDSQKPHGEYHASNENTVNDVERPIPSHRNGAKAGEDRGIAAHVDKTHARVVSLRDPDLARGEDTLESKPGTAA